ncbi:protein zer-1 homolog [Sphaerodactylus townsendi]|uniref:protein zer-1 homolog n=1 Tax=Sphaerodactylus townsendi TaxID=933632 RepID=UPI0020270DB4|nr:protein zer-1 homolog [Sphaerodactylus townsendi]
MLEQVGAGYQKEPLVGKAASSCSPFPIVWLNSNKSCSSLFTFRHLDISRDRLSSYYKFKLTRKVLNLFVENLVNLISLDISGHTMLENCTVPNMEEKANQISTNPEKSSIAPFRNLKRPLRFLGLFDTSLCHLSYIPACQVTGDKNEDQVLNAIEAYTEHRQEITSRAINHLFDIARIERCTQLLRALKVRAMPSFK